MQNSDNILMMIMNHFVFLYMGSAWGSLIIIVIPIRVLQNLTFDSLTFGLRVSQSFSKDSTVTLKIMSKEYNLKFVFTKKEAEKISK